MDPTGVDFHSHEDQPVFSIHDVNGIKLAMFLCGLIAGLIIGYYVLPVALGPSKTTDRTHAHAHDDHH